MPFLHSTYTLYSTQKTRVMEVDIVTRQDLQQFKVELLNEIKTLLAQQGTSGKKWLKSSEVRKMLGISPATLQTLRINRTLQYTKLGGSLYYEVADVEKVLQANKRGTAKM